MSGSLIDASHCVATGAVSEAVVKVFGAVNVEVTGTPTVASLEAAVAEALSTDRKYVFASFKSASGNTGRRLSSRQSAPSRFLASNINVDYEVIVPPNRTKTELVSLARGLSNVSSATGQAFRQSMSSSGVVVVGISEIRQPIAVQSVIVRDEAGNIIKPGQTPSAPSPAPGNESDVNVGAIVGGVVAGVILLVILIGLVYYFLTRSKAES